MITIFDAAGQTLFWKLQLSIGDLSQLQEKELNVESSTFPQMEIARCKSQFGKEDWPVRMVTGQKLVKKGQK